MAEPRGIYNPDPIQPVCEIGKNVAVWSVSQWNYYKATYIEELPRGRAMTFDMGAVAAAGGLVATILGNLRLDDNQLLHLRFKPLDDVVGRLWEQRGQGKFNIKFVHCEVDRMTEEKDPYLATTTFFILGKERDAFLEVQNPTQQAQPMARFAFWGVKYLLEPLTETPAEAVYLPAEGRVA